MASIAAAAAALLPPRLHSPFVSSPQKLAPIPPQFRKSTNNRSLSTRFPTWVAQSSSSSSSAGSQSSWEREEARWLREEQRWLREEQRWIREESRWSSERESLLQEIASLRLKVEALERDRALLSSAEDKLSGLDAVLRALRDSRTTPLPPSPPPPPVPVEEAEVKEMVLEEIRVPRPEVRLDEEKKEEKTKDVKRALRKGSEGKDVRAMQEALERVGFYSGEEDMEYSTFSSGTERAVKTWQASVGTPEDGIMSSELLEKLFMEPPGGGGSFKVSSDQKVDTMPGSGRDSTNGAVVASVTGVAEFQQTVIKDNGNEEVNVSEYRVFLLGENRWEDSSRLIGRDKLISGSKGVSSIRCLTCRGEGRLMCTECDGTGEPNIEPQFLEWIGEGTKCPYCEGLSYTVCDVCEGKTVVEN